MGGRCGREHLTSPTGPGLSPRKFHCGDQAYDVLGTRPGARTDVSL